MACGTWLPFATGLFNNAGSYYQNDIVGCTEQEWDDQVDTSLKGTFLMSKYALPGMIAQGSGVIINNSSGWGIVGGDRAVAYCASKGGVVLLTKAMAVDHGRQGIRVNCICPGIGAISERRPNIVVRPTTYSQSVRGCSATRGCGAFPRTRCSESRFASTTFFTYVKSRDCEPSP